jgi:hypothetical protein
MPRLMIAVPAVLLAVAAVLGLIPSAVPAVERAAARFLDHGAYARWVLHGLAVKWPTVTPVTRRPSMSSTQSSP